MLAIAEVVSRSRGTASRPADEAKPVKAAEHEVIFE